MCWVWKRWKGGWDSSSGRMEATFLQGSRVRSLGSGSTKSVWARRATAGMGRAWLLPTPKVKSPRTLLLEPVGVRIRAGGPKGIWVQERWVEHPPPPRRSSFVTRSPPKRYSAFSGRLFPQYIPQDKENENPGSETPSQGGKEQPLVTQVLSGQGLWRVPPTAPLGWGQNPETGFQAKPEVTAAPAASQGMLSGQSRFSGLKVGSFCTAHPHSSSNYLS